MAEWFKALDLRSSIVRCVGSNPTLRINWLCVVVPDKNNTHEDMEEHIPIIGADYLTYEFNNSSECFTVLSEEWGLIYFIYLTYSI